MLQADALFGLWTAALTQGTAGKSAAFHAALQLLSSQQPAQNTLASKLITLWFYALLSHRNRLTGK